MNDREPLAGILAALKKMSEKRSSGLVLPADDAILTSVQTTTANTKGKHDGH